jgi:hypothetical protein
MSPTDAIAVAALLLIALSMICVLVLVAAVVLDDLFGFEQYIDDQDGEE